MNSSYMSFETDNKSSQIQKSEEKICKMARKCCEQLDAEEKQKMLEDVIPKMMQAMGSKRPGEMFGVMINHCARTMKWMPLIPAGLGIILFALGYYLDAEFVRFLWLAGSVFLVMVASFALAVTRVLGRSQKGISTYFS